MDLFVLGCFLNPSLDDPRKLEFELPIPIESCKIPLIHLQRDFGRFVTTSVLRKESVIIKRLCTAQDYYTPAEIKDIVN